MLDKDEIIDDLKDQVHDLTLEIKDYQREVDQLEKTISKMEVGADAIEEKFQAQIISLKDDIALCDAARLAANALLSNQTDRVKDYRAKYLKALAIAETVRLNGATTYLNTNPGIDLLMWAKEEFSKESNTIIKEN